jgi:hypothetical protein
VVSKLTESKLIGLSWAVLDHDDPEEKDQIKYRSWYQQAARLFQTQLTAKILPLARCY